MEEVKTLQTVNTETCHFNHACAVTLLHVIAVVFVSWNRSPAALWSWGCFGRRVLSWGGPTAVISQGGPPLERTGTTAASIQRFSQETACHSCQSLWTLHFLCAVKSSPSPKMGLWLCVYRHGFLPQGPRLAESLAKYHRARGTFLFTEKWLVVIVTSN